MLILNMLPESFRRLASRRHHHDDARLNSRPTRRDIERDIAKTRRRAERTYHLTPHGPC